MALSPSIAADVGLTDAQWVTPVSVTSRWTTQIDAGGMIVQDAAAITNPTTQIVGVSRHLMTFTGRAGTLVCARMGYSGTPSIDPVILAFGRSVSLDGTLIGPWEKLPTLQATTTTAVTLTTAAASDVTDGTYLYTLVDPLGHVWDRRGNNQILFGVQTIFAVSAGSAAAAFLQAKAL